MQSSDSQADFAAKLGGADQLARLFDHLPEIYFFVKNAEGRFVFANRSILDALGLPDESAIVGKTDYDLFDSDLAARYLEEDNLVMRTREPVVDRVWLVPDRDGTLHWYLSSKRPLFGSGGEVLGIAGVMRDFDRAGSAVGPYRRVSPVLSWVQEHYHEPISVADLADLIDTSVSTLERTFKELFAISPSAYVTRVRLHAARRALAETDDSINDVALDCGFYDQSHFTKKFRATFGTDPVAVPTGPPLRRAGRRGVSESSRKKRRFGRANRPR